MTVSHSPAVRWRHATHRWTETEPVKVQEDLVVGSHLHQVDSFNSITGEKNWSVQVGGYLEQPLVAGDTILISSSNDSSSVGPDTKNEVFGIDVLTGEVRWSHSKNFGQPQVGPDGASYLPSEEGLKRIDSRTGQVQWTRAKTHSVTFGKNGSLYAGGHDENWKYQVSSLDPQSGDALWQLSLDGPRGHTQVQGEIGVTRTSGGRGESKQDLTIFHTQTGQVLYTDTAEFMGVPPRFNSQGHVVYGSGLDEHSKLHCIDPATGEKVWERPVVPVNLYAQEQAHFTEKTLVIDSLKREGRETYGRALVAHDVESGAHLWSADFEPSDGSISLLGSHDGAIFLKQTPDDFSGDAIVALDERTGEALWTHQGETDIASLEHSGEHKVLVKSEDGSFRLQLFEARTGHEQWVFNTGYSLNVEAHDRGVAVVDQDGNIFQLDHDSDRPFQGGKPYNSMIEHTGDSDFYTADPLLKTDLGLALDVNNNGVYNSGRDYLLLRDTDENGRLSDREIKTPVGLEDLEALDHNKDGLVEDSEWLDQGLYLWRDKNQDQVLSQSELLGPQTQLGYLTHFDLLSQKAEYSARGRFDNGHFPDLAPPRYSSQVPSLENPPVYGEGLGDQLQTALRGAQGSWKGEQGSWKAKPTPDGSVADVKVAGWMGKEDKYRFEFQIDGDQCSLTRTHNDRVLHLQIDPEQSLSDKFVFPYPESEHEGRMYKGGALTFSFERGHPSFHHQGQVPYHITADGRENSLGSGGGYGYGFEEKRE